MSFSAEPSSSSSVAGTPTRTAPGLCPRPDLIRGRSASGLWKTRPFWKEVAAFNQMPQPLIDEYYGQYVAVYQGNIVDADPDEGELALRFYRTFGYVPVYIHKVGTEEGLVDVDDR